MHEARAASTLPPLVRSGPCVRLDQVRAERRPAADPHGGPTAQDRLVLARMHPGRRAYGADVAFRERLAGGDVLDHEEGSPETATVGLLGGRPYRRLAERTLDRPDDTDHGLELGEIERERGVRGRVRMRR